MQLLVSKCKTLFKNKYWIAGKSTYALHISGILLTNTVSFIYNSDCMDIIFLSKLIKTSPSEWINLSVWDARSSLDVQTLTLSLPMRETQSSTQKEVESDDNNFSLKVSPNSEPAGFQVKQFIALYLFSGFIEDAASHLFSLHYQLPSAGGSYSVYTRTYQRFSSVSDVNAPTRFVVLYRGDESWWSTWELAAQRPHLKHV